MGELLLNVLPYALGAAAAAPIVAVVTALILSESRRPLLSAWTFTAGAAVLDIAFAVALLAAAEASGAVEGNSELGAILDIALGVLFLGLGVSALVSKPSEEKEQAQRRRVERVARGGLRTMLLAGLGAQVVNLDALAVFTGGLKEVATASVSTVERAIATLVALAVMLVPYYGPAVLYAVSPERSGRALRRMSDWLLGHSRAIEIVVGLGFGAGFLVKGISAI